MTNADPHARVMPDAGRTARRFARRSAEKFSPPPPRPPPPPATAALLAITAALLLPGCATRNTPRAGADGPPATVPADLLRVPDAEPRVEPLRPGGANKPYDALGSSYTPLTADLAVRDAGGASWYGAKFHGQRTASGEPYDMFAMTAAHRTLPIPSYARVRNPANGREVIVRINDRGPFAPGRVIDLSYTAALKLGLLAGVALVTVERLTNDEIRTGLWRRDRTLPPPERLPAANEPLLAAATGDPLGELAGSLATASRPPAMAATRVAAAPVATAAVATSVDLSATAPVAAPTAALAATDVAAAGSPTARGASGGVGTALPTTTDISPSGRPESQPTTTTVASETATATAATNATATTNAVAPSAAPGFWLQIGAFRQRASAMRLQQRVRRDAGWLAPLLSVFDDSSWFRLRAGPYANRADALAAAARVRALLDSTPLLVERRP